MAIKARDIVVLDVRKLTSLYDTLIIAAGSSYSYFGHDDWRAFAAEVKTLESAIDVRGRILRAFEEAEITSDPKERDAHMTFVVVGAGPTGVEMAGQIGELAGDTLRRDFGHDPDLLRDQVTRVVRHELAHHLGWGETGVRGLGL